MAAEAMSTPVTHPLFLYQFSRESLGTDATPNLIPAGLLAMQGRYLGVPR